MRFLRTITILSGLMFLVFSASFSQQNDLSAQLSRMLSANASGYLEPLASGLGAGLNSGIYHSADLHSVLGFDIGVKVGLAMIPSGNKTFDFVMPATIGSGPGLMTRGVDYVSDVPNAPTFAGGKTGIVVKKLTNPGAGTVILTTPAGFDYSRIGLFAPQAAIGLPFGIEVIGRLLPSVNLGDAGKLNMYGIGARYDIDQYIPFCPIDIAVHFMMQKVTVDDKNSNKIMSLSGTAFGAEVSKSLVFFTLYTGLQFESSSLDVDNYTYMDPSGIQAQVNGFSTKGADKTRFLVGFRMLLALINIHADYSISKYPVLTAGVGISFR